ncbi:MAG: hypothetical protein QME75_10635 [Deltaproteobacteria bacterium]|nr:hypothetical protein [Deltaproteobacteria bacterium]
MTGPPKCSCASLPNGWVYLFGPFGVYLGIGRAGNLEELTTLLADVRRWVQISGDN